MEPSRRAAETSLGWITRAGARLGLPWRRPLRRLPLLSVLLLAIAWSAPARADEGAMPLDRLIVKGSHNSFHRRPRLTLFRDHAYEQAPLRVQLEHLGVRALELDLHRSRMGRFEVYHIALIDPRSQCRLFRECLRELREWSDSDPGHDPLIVWIEVKDFAGGVEIRSLDPVDAVLRDELGARLFTPDELQGRYASVHHRLSREGWPTLDELRGRILFMLVGSKEHLGRYTRGFRDLTGRVMFAAAAPDQFGLPWAAVAKINDPTDPDIARARRQHLLVTTTVCVAPFSDEHCRAAREDALRSGANVLMDDYPRPVPGRDYFLDLGGQRLAGTPGDASPRSFSTSRSIANSSAGAGRPTR